MVPSLFEVGSLPLALLQDQENLLTLEVVCGFCQQELLLDFSIPGILCAKVEGDFLFIGDQLVCLGVYPGRQKARCALLGDRVLLIERHAELVRRNRAAPAGENFHLDLGHIAGPALPDFNKGNDDFLKRRPSMHVTASRSLLPKPVDRTGYQDLQIARQSKLGGGEFLETVPIDEPSAGDKPAVLGNHLLAGNVSTQEIALGK